MTLLALWLLALTPYALGSPRAWEAEIRCYASTNKNGEWFEFNEPVPNLASFSFDNTVESVTVTGMWILYQEPDYNTQVSGSVFWLDGIDFTADVPSQYANMASSLRYAGSPFQLNEDSWTMYTGQGFTEDTLYGASDMPSLGRLSADVSSIILTGTSAWTFYQGESYTGGGVCLRPDTHHHNTLFKSFDVGIFPTSAEFNLQDNSIRSVRKGCYSEAVAPYNSTTTYFGEYSASGAWGYFHL
ncbi:uncharacterized protein [Procambarus clarkii]|uniref:uncharacterized protein n=1 Tax=Procambarus clarkii TaxID=6728 RepID=UPI001E671B13|nr:uncharacterized protein LOC123774178 isoform X2 [Procambarus clarkii]